MTADGAEEKKFWQVRLGELEQRLGATRDGLTSVEAAARRTRYGANTLETKRQVPLALKFLGRFRNPLVLILLAAATVSALTGDVTSFIIISTIVLISVGARHACRSTAPSRPPRA